MVRWTTDFDCEKETGFWYCIKDDVFDIQSLKAKRRYEVVKGQRNFACRKIEAGKYSEEIIEILVKAAEGYPAKYRYEVDKEKMRRLIPKWDTQYIVYGAFNGEGKLCGYAYLEKFEKYSEFRVLKVYPCCEKQAINAALVACILGDYEESLVKGHYICDGTRPVQHETNFQDYLEKYFGFRKAYCKLHLKYCRTVKLAVNVLYPFRKVIEKHDDNRLFHRIVGVLKMEEFVRNSNSV